MDEWVDSRIYTDQQIFEEELEKIFKKTWIPVCHESELPKPYDFRTITIAREPIIVCRGPDNKVRAFLNVCPHRGMIIERRPSGSFLEGQPSGNPKRMTCMFHAWQYDMKRQLRLHQPARRKATRIACARRTSACGGCAAR